MRKLSEQQFQFIPNPVNTNIPDPIQNYEIGEDSVPGLMVTTHGRCFSLSESQFLYPENGNKNNVWN